MTSRVLLSGGMDSTLCLVLAMREDPSVEAVACDYGQRHGRRELAAAVLIAQALTVPLTIVRGLDIGRGSLTGEDGELDARGAVLPGRNKALLRAAGWVRGERADEVWIGATADDQEVFVDCRRDYFDALEEEWKPREGAPLRIRSPLVAKTKANIVGMFHERGASNLLAYTYSCYLGEEMACGHCGACAARVRGFALAGIADPGAYEDRRLLSPCPSCQSMGEPTPPGMRCHHPSFGWVGTHSERPVG